MFYVYNDWNNLHEGDWEMIQLNFDAASAAQALDETPVEVGYSQHTGGERAGWGDDKLEIVGGSHPVVYPASGSHAGFFDQALYLGASGSQGVGCDDTRNADLVVRPAVRDDPQRQRDGRARVPLDRVRGAVGRAPAGLLQRPPGPEPEDAVDEADPVVAGVAGQELRGAHRRAPWEPAHTDFFCSTIERGSIGSCGAWSTTRSRPSPAFLAVLAVVVILLWRATWRPAAPLRLARRRTWGQAITSAGGCT